MVAVDLEPGSPPGIKGKFHLVLVDCDGKVIIDKRVDIKKLIRILWEFRPKLIAVDNLTELGENQRELIKFLNLIPPETEVVQVTRVDGEFVDLRELLKVHGMRFTSEKLTPRETALALAFLALKGVGTKVKVFEEKTKIIVTKGRTPRAGGSSMNRFVRATRNAVIETVNEIKSTLEKEGLDYDLFIRKSDGSIDSATFIVYAPRKSLEGLVKPVSSSAVRVKVRPVVTRKFMFEDEEQRTKELLVVGIDPGIKTGLAILNVEGEVLFLGSFKNADRGELVSLINKFGLPIIIATDTSPPSHTAKKLAATLNAELYYPKNSLSVKEKERIAEEYRARGVNVEDSHQRDALAAAHKALNAIKGKIEKVENYLERIGLDVDRDRVRLSVLKEGRSIADVVEEEIGELIKEEGGEEDVYPTAQQPKRNDLEGGGLKSALKLAYLEAENVSLKLKIKELEATIEKLNLELNLIRRQIEDEVERKVSSIKESYSQLTRKVEELQRINEELSSLLEKAGEAALKVERGEAFVALYLDDITFTSKFPEHEIEELPTRAILANKVEALNEDFIEKILENNIMLFASEINEKTKKELEDRGIPVITASGEVYGRYAVLPIDLKDEWNERMEKLKSMRQMQVEDLEKLLQEYRASRWK
ncbi:Protein of unknown function DUF460 [Ignicoccus hospitalis KIN4/I]|uniref:DUF460 domain-containing protein n=1 Tax=Ignicoccus hospitalis (strain KIN4/I / DSM 18386 / JCM 14125) TaxID=453591 RepID=A8ACB6_IGNH4|nr:Protein of unknown function DUF460 [Ignicoccus hospitalis KIN4/I]